MAASNKTLGWVILIGLGLYLFYRVGRASDSPMVGNSFLSTLFPGLDDSLSPDQLAAVPYRRTTQAGNFPQTASQPASPPTARPVGAGPAVVGFVSGSALAGAQVASKLGIGLTGSLAATGIAAGAAVVAWGIIDKGWFRGGEEGVKVNPNRDVFLSQFANFDYTRDDRNPPGFYGLSLVLTHAGRHDLFDAFARASTMDQLSSAINRIVPAIEGMGVDQWMAVHQELINYGVEAA